MKKTSKKVTCEAFRLYTDGGLTAKPVIFLDLWGNSYHGITSTPNQARQMARQFREVAKWLETSGIKYLKTDY